MSGYERKYIVVHDTRKGEKSAIWLVCCTFADHWRVVRQHKTKHAARIDAKNLQAMHSGGTAVRP